MTRSLLALLALLALALALPAVAGAAVSIREVDTTAYPTVRFAAVAPRALARPPAVLEGGRPAAGVQARNLGREKSVVLVVDRSQSMAGNAIRDASAAARGFVAGKPAGDRVAVVSVGSKAITLTRPSASTIDADSALRTIDVDTRYGTALYDAVVAAASSLREEPQQGRVIILLTDGQETTSEATLADAITAARKASAAVYPIGIESRDFRPAPLRRLARATGGTYHRAESTKALAAAYAAIARELARTWHVSFTARARPGETLALSVATPGSPGASARVEIPASLGAGAAGGSDGRALPSLFYLSWIGPVLLALIVAGCIFGAAVALAAGRPGSRLRRRLAPHLDRPKVDRDRRAPRERWGTASALMAATERSFGHLRAWRGLHARIERADVPLKTVEVLYICAGLGLAAGLVFAVAGAPALLILAAMGLGAFLPISWLSWKAKRRVSAIEATLPDMLTTVAASLKAGHSFRQGIQTVVDEGEGPLAQEFRRVLTEAQLGRPMDAALAEMGDRVGSKNLSYVVTAVTIQRQVGGSIAAIFDMVSDTVRSRQQFQRKIRSLTAMGRMSAFVLIGIPVFLALALTALNREYMDPLYTTSTGHRLIGIGILMMGFGAYVLRKVVSFKG